MIKKQIEIIENVIKRRGQLYIYYSIHLVLWPREAENRYCKNSDLSLNVSNHKECQTRCTETTACVGIAYSYKEGSTNHCYICNDDKLSLAGNQFAFYRRKGKAKYQYICTWSRIYH